MSNSSDSEPSNSFQKENQKNKNQKEDSKNEENDKKEKKKRIRRKNAEITERQYKCPDCEKCYSSAPALTNHKKAKHLNINANTNGESENNPTSLIHHKYIDFFSKDNRKPLILDKDKDSSQATSNENKKSLENINNFMKNAFNLRYKYSEKNIEEYPLFKLISENWNKEEPNLDKECYKDDYKNNNQNNEEPKKINEHCIDNLFYLYLKEFSDKTNNEYFEFMVQFSFLLRESLNEQKNYLITEKIKNENKDKNKTEFTQLFNAEEIPELCNHFYAEFLDNNENNFFGLEDKKEEFIELTEHFCFWLYTNKLSPSHLSKIN